MKNVCIMMQKDESLLLQSWIEYHAQIVSYNNLCVLDNGSTNQTVLDLLKTYKDLGVNVIYDFSKPEDFENKSEIVVNISQQYKDADFIFFLDCDEFLGVYHENQMSFEKDVIEEYLKALPDDEQYVYIIDNIYNNMPFKLNCYQKNHYTKVFFRGNTIASLDKGYYGGQTIKNGPLYCTNFLHIHMNHKPYGDLIKGTKEKMKLRVNVDDLDSLREYSGFGEHLVPLLLASEQEYYWSFVDNEYVYSKSFRDKLLEYGIAIHY